jgi:hypothetical protein
MALPVLQAFNPPYALDMTQTRIWVRGTVIWTAQSYVAGGLLPVYQPINDVSGQAVLISTFNVNPDQMTVYSRSGSGYVYVYIKSTGKIMIQTGAAAQSPLTELSAGALPAGVIADLVEFVATWAKL